MAAWRVQAAARKQTCAQGELCKECPDLTNLYVMIQENEAKKACKSFLDTVVFICSIYEPIGKHGLPNCIKFHYFHDQDLAGLLVTDHG